LYVRTTRVSFRAWAREFSVSQPGARAGPRDGTKALIGALLKQQIESKPQSRIGRLATRVDVLRLVANAQFPS
jgi:hypothetical protein